jgi:hypothetical protein
MSDYTGGQPESLTQCSQRLRIVFGTSCRMLGLDFVYAPLRRLADASRVDVSF